MRTVRLACDEGNLDLHLDTEECPVCGGAGVYADFDDTIIGCCNCGGLGLVPYEGDWWRHCDQAAMDAEANGCWFEDGPAPF